MLGLQRTALPLFGGLAVDTSLYANALLAPNLGLRWAVASGAHRFVLGARYTHFVGASTYSDIVTSETPALRSFEPELSGPSFYGVYGLALGPLLVQGEARYAHYTSDYLSFTGGVGFIGAGTIVHARGGVVGLTTAATIFMAAAIGIAAGGALYYLALTAAVLTVFSTFVLRLFDARIDTHKTATNAKAPRSPDPARPAAVRRGPERAG